MEKHFAVDVGQFNPFTPQPFGNVVHHAFQATAVIVCLPVHWQCMQQVRNTTMVMFVFPFSRDRYLRGTETTQFIQPDGISNITDSIQALYWWLFKSAHVGQEWGNARARRQKNEWRLPDVLSRAKPPEGRGDADDVAPMAAHEPWGNLAICHFPYDETKVLFCGSRRNAVGARFIIIRVDRHAIAGSKLQATALHSQFKKIIVYNANVDDRVLGVVQIDHA